MSVLLNATVYRGRPLRETEVPVYVTDDEAELGVAAVECMECEGTGDWDRFMPEPTGCDNPCVECKGTGHILVSI